MNLHILATAIAFAALTSTSLCAQTQQLSHSDFRAQLSTIAGEFLGSGWQRAYLQSTACNRFKVGRDGALAMRQAEKEIRQSGVVEDEMLEAFVGITSRLGDILRRDVDRDLPQNPTAFDCGTVAGKLDFNLKAARDKFKSLAEAARASGYVLKH
jgi:hypothetical protein